LSKSEIALFKFSTFSAGVLLAICSVLAGSLDTGEPSATYSQIMPENLLEMQRMLVLMYLFMKVGS